MPLRKPLRQAENVREFDDAGVDRTTTDAVMHPTKRERRHVPRFEMVGRRGISARTIRGRGRGRR